jgi:hypothetical protein
MIYDVVLVPQSNSMSCWAASISMILSWQRNASFDPSQIAKNPGGPSYMPAFNNGLDPNDRYILEQNGFTVQTGQCYQPDAIYSLLDNQGPLWIAGLVLLPGVTSASPHIRVLTGYDANSLYVNDPWPVNAGRQYPTSYSIFFGEMEKLASQELSQPNPVYLAYVNG